jgi:hypothetical protein
VSGVEALRTQNQALIAREQEVAALRANTSERARLAGEEAALRRQLASRRDGPRPANGGGEYVTMKLPNVDVKTVLSAYELYAGRKIAIDPSIDQTRVVIDLTTGLLTREEAMDLLRSELRKRANIAIETAPDGSIMAKQVFR